MSKLIPKKYIDIIYDFYDDILMFVSDDEVIINICLFDLLFAENQ